MAGLEADAHDEQIPEGSLAKLLAEVPALRQTALSEGHFTKWGSEQQIGVRSVANMRLNAVALVVVAKWWCPRWQYPKSLTINLCRQEVPSHKDTFKTH